jgi:hypothetical protein
LDRKVAIQGYVAYFKQGKALKGKGFDFNIWGSDLLFSSASNKSAFAKSPLSYEPQYGAGVLLPWVIQEIK